MYPHIVREPPKRLGQEKASGRTPGGREDCPFQAAKVIFYLGATCGQCSTHHGRRRQRWLLEREMLDKGDVQRRAEHKMVKFQEFVGSGYLRRPSNIPAPSSMRCPASFPQVMLNLPGRAVSTISTFETTDLWSQDWIFRTDAIGSLVYTHSLFKIRKLQTLLSESSRKESSHQKMRGKVSPEIPLGTV